MSLPITEDLNPGAYCSTQSNTKKTETNKCRFAKLHLIQGDIQPDVVAHGFYIIYEQMQRSSMKRLDSWTGSYLYLHKLVCPDRSTPCLLCDRG